jgi:histidine phosphotransferase ChpT
MSDGLLAHELASKLAMRLCHDFAGPAGAIVSGLDMLAGAPSVGLKGAAEEMIDTSGRKLLALVTFSRVAFGMGDEVFDTGALEDLAGGVFSELRPTLDWSVEAPALAGPAARTLLNLVQIAADALALGGVARAWAAPRGGKIHLGVDALGARAKAHPEMLGGLRGEALREGLSGRWVQAYFVHVMVAAAGGEVTGEVSETGIRFKAVLPQGSIAS